MKVLIADDHAMIRTGLKQLCASLWDGVTLLEAGDGAMALDLQKRERPQVTILDLNMPGVSGLELLRQVLAADGHARVLVFSMHGEPVYAARALGIGARGYWPQSDADRPQYNEHDQAVMQPSMSNTPGPFSGPEV